MIALEEARVAKKVGRVWLSIIDLMKGQ